MHPHRHYLIIDDSEIDRIITSRLLKVRLGATEMLFADNGLTAINLIKKRREDFRQPLVILLDIQMPQMDGFQFLEEYESMDQSLKDKTQIFMLSSTLDPRDTERAEKHDFVTTLLGKPLHIEQLMLLLQNG